MMPDTEAPVMQDMPSWHDAEADYKQRYPGLTPEQLQHVGLIYEQRRQTGSADPVPAEQRWNQIGEEIYRRTGGRDTPLGQLTPEQSRNRRDAQEHLREAMRLHPQFESPQGTDSGVRQAYQAHQHALNDLTGSPITLPANEPYNLQGDDQRRQQGALLRERMRPSDQAQEALSWLPFVRSGVGIASDIDLRNARQRIARGQGRDEDYQTVATAGVRQETAQHHTDPVYGFAREAVPMAAELATPIPGLGGAEAGEAASGANALRWLNLPRTAAVTGGVGRALGAGADFAATRLLPQVAHQAVQRNIEAGRDPFDVAGFPGAFLNNMVQGAVFEALGPAGRALGGASRTGLEGVVQRFGQRAIAGTGLQQGGEVLTGLMSQVLPEWLAPETRPGFGQGQRGYGAIGSWLRGDRGQAMQDLGMSLVTNALFAGMHATGDNPQAERARIAREMVARGEAEHRRLTGQGISEEGAARILSQMLIRSPEVPARGQEPSQPGQVAGLFGQAPENRSGPAMPERTPEGWGLAPEQPQTPQASPQAPPEAPVAPAPTPAPTQPHQGARPSLDQLRQQAAVEPPSPARQRAHEAQRRQQGARVEPPPAPTGPSPERITELRAMLQSLGAKAKDIKTDAQVVAEATRLGILQATESKPAGPRQPDRPPVAPEPPKASAEATVVPEAATSVQRPNNEPGPRIGRQAVMQQIIAHIEAGGKASLWDHGREKPLTLRHGTLREAGDSRDLPESFFPESMGWSMQNPEHSAYGKTKFGVELRSGRRRGHQASTEAPAAPEAKPHADPALEAVRTAMGRSFEPQNPEDFGYLRHEAAIGQHAGRDLIVTLKREADGPVAEVLFRHDTESGEDFGQAGHLQAGTREFLRRLKAFTEKLGSQGIGIRYSAEPQRARLYARSLADRFVLANETVKGHETTYTWKPKPPEAPKPPEPPEPPPAGKAQGYSLYHNAEVVREHIPGWKAGEDHHWQDHPEPAAALNDQQLAERANRDALPTPKGAEKAPASFRRAWDVVSRLWPEGAEMVKAVQIVPPIKGRKMRAAMRRDGTLLIPEGGEITPETLWHELVHRQQDREGRMVPQKERTDAQHLEMEREAYSRAAQMEASGAFDKMAKKPEPALSPEEVQHQRDLAESKAGEQRRQAAIELSQKRISEFMAELKRRFPDGKYPPDNRLAEQITALSEEFSAYYNGAIPSEHHVRRLQELQPEPAAPARMTPQELHDRLASGQEVPGIHPRQSRRLFEHIVRGRSFEDIGRSETPPVTREAIRRDVENALQALHPLTEEPLPPTVKEKEDERIAPTKEELSNRRARQGQEPHEDILDQILEQVIKEQASGRITPDRIALWKRLTDAVEHESTRQSHQGRASRRALKELGKAREESGESPQRVNVEPPSVPGASERSVPGSPQDAGSEAPHQGANRAPQGNGEGPPAPAVPETSSHELDRSEVDSLAREMLQHDQEHTGLYNAFLRRLWAELKSHGVTPQQVRSNRARGGDEVSLRGADEAAMTAARLRPDLFPDGPDTSRLLELLNQGMRKPLTKKEAVEQAEGVVASRQGMLAPQTVEPTQGKLFGFGSAVEGKVDYGTSRKADPLYQREPGVEEPEVGGGPTGQHSEPLEDAPFRAQQPDQPVPHQGSRFGATLTPEEKARQFGGGQEAAVGVQPPQREYALANAKVDEQRQREGLPPLMSMARQENTTSWDIAMRQLARDPEAGAKLVESLKNKIRPVTVEEGALLLQRTIALDNEFRRAMGDWMELRRSGNLEEAESAFQRANKLGADLPDLHRILRDTGTLAGRSFQFRRQMAKEDFSLSGMFHQFEAATGRPPNEQEQARITQLQQEIDALTQRALAAEEQLKNVRAKPGDVQGARRAALSPEWQEVQRTTGEMKGKQGEFQGMLDAGKRERQGPVDRVLDWLHRIVRFNVLSHPKTFLKLAGAAVNRFAITPLEDVIGSALSQIPIVGEVARRSGAEGAGFSLDTQKASFKQAFYEGLKDSIATIMKGQSSLEANYGREPSSTSWGVAETKADKARAFLDTPGLLHGAVKAPVKRYSLTKSFLERMVQGAKRDEDVTSPAAMAVNGALAYVDANRSIFLQDNLASTWWKRGLETLRREGGTTGKIAAGLMDAAMPIVRVPTNIVAETMQYAVGTITGSTRLALAYKKGIQNMTPAEGDLIMRSLKKGSLGAAALLTGYLAPAMFGGLYSGKRKDSGPEPGSVGGAPPVFFHHPLWEAAQLGATVRKEEEKQTGKKGHKVAQGIAQGIPRGALALAGELPFAHAVRNVQSLAEGRSAGHALGEYLKTMTLPQVMQFIAGRTDALQRGGNLFSDTPRRHPGSIGQQFQMGIPGARQNVPLQRAAH